MKNSPLNLEQQQKREIVSKSKPSVILKLAFLQFLSALVICLVLYFCTDTRFAISALLGGSIAAVTSLYMAGRLFSSQGGHEAPLMLGRFYSSVVLKVLFTLSMMAICIIVVKVALLPFIIAYLIAAVVVNLLFLLLPIDDISINGISHK